jgi:uncharacterized protein YkwD
MLRSALKSYGLGVLVSASLGLPILLQLHRLHEEPQPATSSTTSAIQPSERLPGILAAVNDYRSTKHLPPLTLNKDLNSSSQAKAHDLVADQYWSHNPPDVTTPWDFMIKAGYDYKTA